MRTWVIHEEVRFRRQPHPNRHRRKTWVNAPSHPELPHPNPCERLFGCVRHGTLPRALGKKASMSKRVKRGGPREAGKYWLFNLCGWLLSLYTCNMTFTALHRALGREPSPLTDELLDCAVERGVKKSGDLDWKSKLPLREGLPNTDFPKDVAAMANRGCHRVRCSGVPEESYRTS